MRGELEDLLDVGAHLDVVEHLVALVDHKVAQRPELEVALLGQLLDAARRADDDVWRGGPLEDVLVLLDREPAEEVGDADACSDSFFFPK